MQKALIHWCDSICFHFDAASVYKSNAACVRQSTRDKNNWIRLLDAQSSDLKKKEKNFNKLQNTPKQKRREKINKKQRLFEMKLCCLHHEEADMSFPSRRFNFTDLLVLHFIFSSPLTFLSVSPQGIMNVSLVVFF